MLRPSAGRTEKSSGFTTNSGHGSNRARASNTFRASSGSDRTTAGTPGLRIPAFSPAIAATVLPRYCM